MDAPRYSEEAAREILKRAVDLQTVDREFSRVQLTEMAEELGISEEALQAAEKSWLADRKEVEERRAFERYRRQALRAHFVTYLLVNTFLFFLNVVTSFGDWWFIFPLLGWGLGLAIHAWSTTQTEGDQYEREFLQWRAKRKLKDAVYRRLSL